MTRLLIVSDMPHHRQGGGIVGHGSTVREIDRLAGLFDDVRHLGFIESGPAPGSALPYSASNVTFVPLVASGGATRRAKWHVLARLPGYALAIARELRQADAVHVRCPASSSLMAILLLALWHRPGRRWIKYAGNWGGYPGEPASYRFQRWWLATGLHRGTVSINGVWPGQAPFMRSLPNPCLTDEELRLGVEAARGKPPPDPLRVVFVGALTHEKGAETVVRTAAALRARGVCAAFELVGEGPLRPHLEGLLQELDLRESVRLLGALPRPEIGPLYAAAHVNLLPSLTEGWPKVLSEGMAYGVVPVASAVGSIPHELGRHGTGTSVRGSAPEPYAEAIEAYALDPSRWGRESQRAVRAAAECGFAHFLTLVGPILLSDHDRREPGA